MCCDCTIPLFELSTISEMPMNKASRFSICIYSGRLLYNSRLDTFELENLEHVKPETIWSLADNNYIRRHENIICMGNPGMGKTHLSIALGIL